MTARARLETLHAALNDVVKLYQFRSRDQKLYSGVTVAQAYCLRALWNGGELSMGELARRVTVSVSTMTGVVDQLEAKRLVLRRADVGDRRSVRVRLSAAGRRVYGAALEEFHERLGRVANGYTSGELEVIQRFLREFAGMIAEWRSIDLAPEPAETRVAATRVAETAS